MHVLILNGSPRKERGATFGVLKHFIQGLEKGGAEVEVIHVSQLKVGPCRGCFNCWTATPGECIQDDSMKELLPQIDQTDVLVYATPVYVDGMTGSLKNVIDRTIPLSNGKVELVDGHCRHPVRSGRVGGKIAVLSVCGFAELDNFDSLVHHVQAIAKNEHREYIGAILRPYAWAFEHADRFGVKIGDIIQAVIDAGEQIAKNGSMKQETLDIISKEIIPPKIVAEVISRQFQ
ncbi:MAG: flavodoxin family protein [Candidatus Thorarchaeota archaeon]|jgi:multimeric flavodoxin WrbA